MRMRAARAVLALSALAVCATAAVASHAEPPEGWAEARPNGSPDHLLRLLQETSSRARAPRADLALLTDRFLAESARVGYFSQSERVIGGLIDPAAFNGADRGVLRAEFNDFLRSRGTMFWNNTYAIRNIPLYLVTQEGGIPRQLANVPLGHFNERYLARAVLKAALEEHIHMWEDWVGRQRALEATPLYRQYLSVTGRAFDGEAFAADLLREMGQPMQNWEIDRYPERGEYDRWLRENTDQRLNRPATARGAGGVAESVAPSADPPPADAAARPAAENLNLTRFSRWGHAKIPYTPSVGGLLMGVSLALHARKDPVKAVKSFVAGVALWEGGMAGMRGLAAAASYAKWARTANAITRARVIVSRTAVPLMVLTVALEGADWIAGTNTPENLSIILYYKLHPELFAAAPGPADLGAYYD